MNTMEVLTLLLVIFAALTNIGNHKKIIVLQSAKLRAIISHLKGNQY